MNAFMPSIALPTGPYDWHEEIISRATYENRLEGLRAAMHARGLTHTIVYGNIFDSEALAFFSSFTPKLGPAVLLVPQAGDVRLLFSGGPGMAPSARRLTFIENVAALRHLAKDIGEWIAGQSGGCVGLVCGDGVTQGDFLAMNGSVPDGLVPLDDVFSLLCNAQDVLEGVRASAELLQRCANRMAADFCDQADLSTFVLDAERFAFSLGVQDMRLRIARKPWGRAVALPDQAVRMAAPVPVALAVRFRGWWTQGQFVLGDFAGMAADIAHALETASAGKAYANRVAFPSAPNSEAGLRYVFVERNSGRWSALCNDGGLQREFLFKPPGL
jgi:hypothetical protein